MEQVTLKRQETRLLCLSRCHAFIVRHKKEGLFASLAFIFPIIIMAVILATQGIWWESKTTILASDSFHQYVIFNQQFRNVMHGQDSLFYTFTSGGGLNFYALISYYLGSFLTPFTFFFNLSNMPDALYLFTLIKFGAAGFTSYLWLSRVYTSVNRLLILSLSTAYCLSSFAVSQLELHNWLDVFVLAPLVLLGLHSLLQEKGRVLYFTSLLFLFIQNYYFGFMMALFLSLFVLVQLLEINTRRVQRFIDFIIVSVLAGISSLIMILPAYLDLRRQGESFTAISKLQTENSWWLDIFAKQLIGSYDTTKYGAVPMIYAGLLPLLLALFFFTLTSIRWQVRLGYASLFTIIIASFYLVPLDLLWQGFHAPNMFLHRYAWVFFLLVIYLAGQTLSHLSDLCPWRILLPLLVTSTGFIALCFFLEHYHYLSILSITLSFGFLIAFTVLVYLFLYKKNWLPYIAYCLFLLTLSEISCNTYLQVVGLKKEWGFPSRNAYQRDLQAIDTLVNKENVDTLSRTEKTVIQTGNDSMKFHYNGISQFSSIRNRHSSQTLDKLGFKSIGANLNTRYQNNTLAAESLLGVRYNITRVNTPNKFGFTGVSNKLDWYLYENTYAAPLAILTPTPLVDVPLSTFTLDNQTLLLNTLSGQNKQYFTQIPIKNSHDPSHSFSTFPIGPLKNSPIDKEKSYDITVPAHSQAYLFVPSLSFSNKTDHMLEVSVNDDRFTYSMDNSSSFLNIGYFDVQTSLTISLKAMTDDNAFWSEPIFYRLNTDNYQEAMTAINQHRPKVTQDKNNVFIDYNSPNTSSLFLTIPYDKGWHASQNGKNLPIHQAYDGFMMIEVSKGKGRITLTFIPSGFYLGSLCFFAGLALFLCYRYHKQRGYKKTLI